MAYLPTIPAATDKLSTSQSQIQGNFTAIDDGASAGFAQDHVGLTELSDVGKHKKVTLTTQAVAPVAAGTDLILYNALNADTSRQEVYATSTALTYPITAGKRAVAGWARIGGGAYLIWNSPTTDANTTTDTTLDLSHCPAGGTILSAQVTPFPSSVSGADNDYVIQVTSLAGSVTVGAFTKSASTATRLASKRFTFLVIRL